MQCSLTKQATILQLSTFGVCREVGPCSEFFSISLFVPLKLIFFYDDKIQCMTINFINDLFSV